MAISPPLEWQLHFLPSARSIAQHFGIFTQSIVKKQRRISAGPDMGTIVPLSQVSVKALFQEF
jgi:hypothetical protein